MTQVPSTDASRGCLETTRECLTTVCTQVTTTAGNIWSNYLQPCLSAIAQKVVDAWNALTTYAQDPNNQKTITGFCAGIVVGVVTTLFLSWMCGCGSSGPVPPPVTGNQSLTGSGTGTGTGTGANGRVV